MGVGDMNRSKTPLKFAPKHINCDKNRQELENWNRRKSYNPMLSARANKKSIDQQNLERKNGSTLSRSDVLILINCCPLSAVVCCAVVFFLFVSIHIYCVLPFVQLLAFLLLSGRQEYDIRTELIVFVAYRLFFLLYILLD